MFELRNSFRMNAVLGSPAVHKNQYGSDILYFALNYCNESTEFCEDKKAFVNCCNLKLKHFLFPFGRRNNAKEEKSKTIYFLYFYHYVYPHDYSKMET